MSSSISKMSEEEIRPVEGAWPGGPCPECGDDMPANVVHCMTCRAMLNSELRDDTVEVPEFVPLPEIQAAPHVQSKGHFVCCPGCSEELRINAKYVGAKVQCRHCEHVFDYDASVKQVAVYTDCVHCSRELRASLRFLGNDVACRFCNGPLHLG